MLFLKKYKYNDNNLAICYYRFSSHAQNEASIDQQREQAKFFAQTHDLKIIKEYSDEAISGTTDNRPGFQQMLSEVAKLKPSTLIVWKVDRLGRDRTNIAIAKDKKYKTKDIKIQDKRYLIRNSSYKIEKRLRSYEIM